MGKVARCTALVCTTRLTRYNTSSTWYSVWALINSLSHYSLSNIKGQMDWATPLHDLLIFKGIYTSSRLTSIRCKTYTYVALFKTFSYSFNLQSHITKNFKFRKKNVMFTPCGSNTFIIAYGIFVINIQSFGKPLGIFTASSIVNPDFSFWKSRRKPLQKQGHLWSPSPGGKQPNRERAQRHLFWLCVCVLYAATFSDDAARCCCERPIIFGSSAASAATAAVHVQEIVAQEHRRRLLTWLLLPGVSQIMLVNLRGLALRAPPRIFAWFAGCRYHVY